MLTKTECKIRRLMTIISKVATEIRRSADHGGKWAAAMRQCLLLFNFYKGVAPMGQGG
jgi:hypothetical protein